MLVLVDLSRLTGSTERRTAVRRGLRLLGLRGLRLRVSARRGERLGATLHA